MSRARCRAPVPAAAVACTSSRHSRHSAVLVADRQPSSTSSARRAVVTTADRRASMPARLLHRLARCATHHRKHAHPSVSPYRAVARHARAGIETSSRHLPTSPARAGTAFCHRSAPSRINGALCRASAATRRIADKLEGARNTRPSCNLDVRYLCNADLTGCSTFMRSSPASSLRLSIGMPRGTCSMSVGSWRSTSRLGRIKAAVLVCGACGRCGWRTLSLDRNSARDRRAIETPLVAGVARVEGWSCGALAQHHHNLEGGQLFDADPGQRFGAV